MTEVVVLGGGISGLSTAYKIQELAKKADLKLNITLIEKEARLGGKIMSVKRSGFICESGPAAFLDNKPETPKIAMGLELEVLPSTEAAKKRFIFFDKKLRKVPDGLKSFLTSDILSIKGKLRVFMEPFTKVTEEKDESIAGFGRRHLGREAEEKLISAMVIGIHAGDSEKLSLKSCFPVMHELEKQGNGSLIRAMLKRMKKAKKKENVKAVPTGNLNSFKNGMFDLVNSLEKALEAEIIKGKTVKSVRKNRNGGYEILIDNDSSSVKADVLVIALPSYSSKNVLESLDKRFSSELSKIPYVPATVICLGYKKEDVPLSVEGFGFLIPKIDKRKILGCRWDSSTFKHRSPEGHILLWNIVGGAINPETALMEDEKILELVKNELKEIMGIAEDPVFTEIFRHKKAIPQYMIGHERILANLDTILKDYPGLYLTGNAFRGVGIEDCVRNSTIISKEILNYVKGSS